MKRQSNISWLAIEFKLQDFWIGVFWDYKKADYSVAGFHCTQDFHLWICLIPCFPIHYIKALGGE